MSTHRSYIIRPKLAAAPVITHTMEREVLPMLRTQKGFRDGPIVTHSHTALSSDFKLVEYGGVRRSLKPFVVSEVLKALRKARGNNND